MLATQKRTIGTRWDRHHLFGPDISLHPWLCRLRCQQQAGGGVRGPSAGLRCQSGDSGAPWFAYTTAFGIMSSCGENLVNGTDSAANYTSMDAAYARNYRLAF